jgi:hypothetical protein
VIAAATLRAAGDALILAGAQVAAHDPRELEPLHSHKANK